MSTSGPDPKAAAAASRTKKWPGAVVGWSAAVLLSSLHGAAIWVGMGGAKGVGSPWPIAVHDHPLYFHSALVTRAFLHQSGTTAGYDPSFMAGYPKSVVWPSSSTLPELVMYGFGADLGSMGGRAAVAYKVYVLVSAALLPWLVAGAAGILGLGGGVAALGVAAYLVYIWTDFPINYAAFGMLPYLLAIPLALVTTACLARYLDRGGIGWWLALAASGSLTLLVHFTTAMVVLPAALVALAAAGVLAASAGRPLRAARYLGLGNAGLLALALNAFWWLPGLWLARTKGASGFAFSHSSESVAGRLGEIATRSPAIELVLCLVGFAGAIVLARRDRVAAAALGGFILAGFGWGYLAGAFAALDALQPGRHTYAFYSGLAIAAGLALAALVKGITERSRLAGCGVVFAAIAASGVLFGPGLIGSLRYRLFFGEPFLSSRPSPRLSWLLARVRANVKPGERVLYEESGFTVDNLPDPFQGGRFSGLLPHLAGVEVIGGPYLHASLSTNFTQFGEGRLFGQANWDRAHFERYAKLYRPAAIICWTPWARAFCRANPDLVETLSVLNLGPEGAILFGRVHGFAGKAVRGEARVTARPGRLTVDRTAAELDGSVVLGYHFVPLLGSRPPGLGEPIRLEGDPVPFIGLGKTPSAVRFQLDLPP